MIRALRRHLEHALYLREVRRNFAHEPIAIHEAGHIAASFEMAELKGIEPADAVAYAEMDCEEVRSRWHKAASFSFGTVWPGPQWEEYLLANAPTNCTQADTKFNDKATAEIIIVVAGAAAQARATGRSVKEILLEAEGDCKNAISIFRLTGRPDKEFKDLINYALDYLERLWSDSRKWDALLEMASSLPHRGKITGPECWDIYSSAFVRFAFAEAVSKLPCARWLQFGTRLDLQWVQSLRHLFSVFSSATLKLLGWEPHRREVSG